MQCYSNLFHESSIFDFDLMVILDAIYTSDDQNYFLIYKEEKFHSITSRSKMNIQPSFLQ